MRTFFALLVAVSANAQVVATSGSNIVVAHENRIELFDARLQRAWTAEGVANATRVVTSANRFAVIDTFANRVRIVDATGQGETLTTAESPVDGVFIGNDLWLIDRDANALERAGTRERIELPDDPAFIRRANNLVYVYCRASGVVVEIDPPRITRRLNIAPFASDFEVDGATGYLAYPHEAKMRTFALRTMTAKSEAGAGVVPVDLAVASKGNALSASRLALADPSAKRVWIVEGEQSVAKAIARGFVRGLLGLGLFAPKSSDFPTGVDRVLSRGSITLAYDSSSATLYRVSGKKATVIARGIAPNAFAITENGVALWENGALRLIR